MVKMYEAIVLLKPTLSEAETAGITTKIKTYIAEGKGELVEEKKAEKRHIPFIVKKSREAYQCYFKFSADSLVINTIKDRIRLIEGINRLTMANASVTVKEPEKIRKKKETAPVAAAAPATAAPAAAPVPPAASETAPKEPQA
jgi:ribosomal protein S6